MTDTSCQNAAEKVQILVAIYIPYINPLSVIQRDRISVVKQVARPEVFSLFCDYFVFIHVYS